MTDGLVIDKDGIPILMKEARKRKAERDGKKLAPYFAEEKILEKKAEKKSWRNRISLGFYLALIIGFVILLIGFSSSLRWLLDNIISAIRLIPPAFPTSYQDIIPFLRDGLYFIAGTAPEWGIPVLYGVGALVFIAAFFYRGFNGKLIRAFEIVFTVGRDILLWIVDIIVFSLFRRFTGYGSTVEIYGPGEKPD